MVITTDLMGLFLFMMSKFPENVYQNAYLLCRFPLKML